MKPSCLTAILFAVVFGCLAQKNLYAQESDNCEVYYCTSYAEWDSGSGTVSGYAEYFDDSEDFYIGITACVNSPTSGYNNCVSNDGWDYAEAETDSSVNANGQWGVMGLPYYYTDGPGSYYEDDGDTEYDVAVIEQPTGETASAYATIDAGEQFMVTLQPTTFSFDAYQVAESLSSLTDGCYETYGIIAISGIISGSPKYPSGNNYPDNIYSTDTYIHDYETATNGNNGNCSWSVFQSLTYAGGSQYASWYDGQTITYGNWLETFRGPAYDTRNY
jgi:hypothetical protein